MNDDDVKTGQLYSCNCGCEWTCYVKVLYRIASAKIKYEVRVFNRYYSPPCKDTEQNVIAGETCLVAHYNLSPIKEGVEELLLL